MHQKTQKTSDIKCKFDAPVIALDRWQPEIRAADKDDEKNVINIFSRIGESMFESGFSANEMNEALVKSDGGDVVVNLNSPGGDFFEGLAIHSLLAAHEGNVEMRVLGLAASAASVIAMAGDDVQIADSAFIMVHNSWTMALGNKGDLREVADMLAKFDKSMVKMFVKATGLEEKEITKMMDAETFIDAETALEKGFANSILGEDMVIIDESEVNNYTSDLRKVDTALAKAGMPRSERRHLIKSLTDSTPSAAKETTPSAGLSEALSGLLNVIKT